MKTSSWIAIGLFCATAAWLASGYVKDSEDQQEQPEATAAEPTLVEVRSSKAKTVPRYIFAQGVAQPFRTGDIVSELSGTIDAVLVQEGDKIEAGAVVARLLPEARSSRLESAQANVDALEAELEDFRQLAEEGVVPDNRIRELEAQLEEARASLDVARRNVHDTVIRAAVPGIVSDVFVNAGQFVPAGATIARVVDNSPLRVTVHISQRQIERVDPGGAGLVSFATGELARGRICFIAPAADPETRTFRVELRVPNEDLSIPSIISTEVRVKTGEEDAHFISPAIFALNEEGVLGVKSVGDDRIVKFIPVTVLRAAKDGVWVTGLPARLKLISTGQGFVRAGETVRVATADGQTTAASDAQTVALPTSTTRSDPFARAGKLDSKPPSAEICNLRGAGAVVNSFSASSFSASGMAPAFQETRAPSTQNAGAASQDVRDSAAPASTSEKSSLGTGAQRGEQGNPQ